MHINVNIYFLIIEMKTFNVPKFYNGFCCYLKSTYSSFDKVIKLLTFILLTSDKNGVSPILIIQGQL
jgi:hypothetical protein